MTGLCIMYSDLMCYMACTKHNIKLGNNKECGACGEPDNGQFDYKCSMIMENQDDGSIVSILVFKRHLDISIEDMTLDDNNAHIIAEKMHIKIE